MTSPTLSRLAGPVMTAGAGLSAIGYVLTSFTPSTHTPASVASPVFVAGSLLVYLGSALILLTRGIRAAGLFPRGP
jgi:drug/metabolite transporter (DMT)-like permease